MNDVFRSAAVLAAAAFATVLVLPTRSRAATPLAYATTWDDGQGRERRVTFDGSAARGVVAGTLRIDSYALTVKGLIATDGSVSGTLYRPNGTQAATFSARPDRNGILRGNVTYGGTARPWSAPGVALPSATVP
jgi:hypothetical protein